MTPKVSIILTTHGEAPYLKQAIGSVLAQTFEDWECIIAIDGTDFLSNAYEFQKIEHRIHALGLNIEDRPCRFAYSINKAFVQTRGDYITYLCHDDLYLPWRLDWMVHALELYQWEVCFGHQKMLGKNCPPGVLDGDVRLGNLASPAGTVDHSSVIHRRECFEKAGGWDENAPARYGDAYFWLRLQNAGYKFHCIPEVLDVHRFNEHSLTWKLDHPELAAKA